MRKTKKYNGLAGCIAVLCLLFAGCGQSGENEDLVFEWPLGTSSPEDTVTQVFAEKFAEEVFMRSDGRMRIDIYPNSTIGNDNELLECCEDGDIPFVVQNTAPQVNYMPEMAVFDLPCAFSKIEEARNAVDNEKFYSTMEEIYNKSGYTLLGIADQGFRVMTTNKKIETISDYTGQKIRTMENANHLAFWQALKANPTPMAFSEVYIGLQQRTIDAEENPVEVIVSGKLYEQQDYVVETNHLTHYIMLFMNQGLFDGLEEEQQEILTAAGRAASDYAREQADERVEDRLGHIEESGTEIITLSEELYREMQEASSDIYKDIRRQVGNELVDLYIGEK